MALIDKIVNNKHLYSNKKLKQSYAYISNYLNVSESSIRKAVKEFRKQNKAITGTLSQPSTTYNREAKNLVKSHKNSIKSITINSPGTYLVTGCVHAPFHNKKMYNSVYNYITSEVKKLDGIILNGDIVDLYSLSKHDRGNISIPGVDLDHEYREASKFLNLIDNLAEETGVKYKIYLYGNHEDRYLRVMKEIDISKFGKALKSPEEGLNLHERGYDVILDWKLGHINLGPKLEINHGEFLNVHTAKKTIDTYRKSVLYNHTHRFQIYSEGEVGGFNMGFGGDINSKVFNYATRAMKSSWTNACCLVTLDNDLEYHIQPLIFKNNKLIVNGRSY